MKCKSAAGCRKTELNLVGDLYLVVDAQQRRYGIGIFTLMNGLNLW